MKECNFCGEEIQDSAIKCRYCGEWLNKLEDKNRQEEEEEEEEENEKNNIDFKSKLLNIIIHIIYFILSILIGLLLSISYKEDYSFFSFFIGNFLLLYFVGFYGYKKIRGGLSNSFNKNKWKILKGTIRMIIILSIYLLGYISNQHYKNNHEINDLKNIKSNISESIKNNEEFFDNIESLKTNSNLGESLKNYLKEKQDISIKYQDQINLVGNIFLDYNKFNNINEISNILKNLNKLSELREEYINNIKELNHKYPLIINYFNENEEREKGFPKTEIKFIEAEKEFIKSSVDLYFYLTKIEEYITYDEGKIVIENDESRKIINNLIKLNSEKLINYQNEISNVEKREKEIIKEFKK